VRVILSVKINIIREERSPGFQEVSETGRVVDQETYVYRDIPVDVEPVRTARIIISVTGEQETEKPLLRFFDRNWKHDIRERDIVEHGGKRFRVTRIGAWEHSHIEIVGES